MPSSLAVMTGGLFGPHPHLGTAHWDPLLTGALIGAGMVGAFLGARFTSLYVPSNRLKQLFGLLIVIMTAYKIYTLIGG